MNGYQRDPDRPFEDIVRDIKREHRNGRRRRAPRDSRPRTRSELGRQYRLRWTVAVVLGLGLAVVVALLIPT